jgi:hypothetical protein
LRCFAKCLAPYEKHSKLFSPKMTSIVSCDLSDSRMAAVNVFVSAVTADNISRNDLVDWVNSMLSLSYSKVENLCSGIISCSCLCLLVAALICAGQHLSGAAYCQLMDALFPGIPCSLISSLGSNVNFFTLILGSGCVNVKKVRFDAKNEYEFLENFKVRSISVTAAAVSVTLPTKLFARCCKLPSSSRASTRSCRWKSWSKADFRITSSLLSGSKRYALYLSRCF